MGIDFRDARYRRFVTLGKRTVKDGECMVVWNRKGAARVVSAVLRPTQHYPYMFSFFSEEGKDFQLHVDSPEKLQMWMGALPMLQVLQLG